MDQNEISSAVSEYLKQSEDKIQLRESMGIAMKTEPDFEAELQNVSAKTGVPLETVRSLPQESKAKAKVQEVDVDDLAINFPKASKFLSDPKNAVVSSDDIGVFKSLENGWKAFKSGIEKGSIQDDLGMLHYKDLEGEITEAEKMHLELLKSRMQGVEQESSKDDSKLSYFLGQTGYSGRQMITSVREGAKGGVAGAAVGAGTAAVLGQIGPQIALPEELVTVPGAAIAGGRYGFMAGSALQSYRAEAGFAWDEFKNIRDESGQPINPDIAKGAAKAVGLLNAGLDVVGEVAMLKLFPGFDKLLSVGPKQAVKEILKDQTKAQALASFGKRWIKAATIEGMTEGIQELSVILGAEGAKLADGGSFASPTVGESASRIGQSAQDAFVGSLGLGAAGGATNQIQMTVRDRIEAQRMQRNADLIKAIGDTSKESKLLARMPEKYKELVSTIKEGGPVENVFIPAERFVQYFQSKGVDPAIVAEEVGAKNFKEAVAAGSDIMIPIEDYASHIADTEHHDQLAEDIRFDQSEKTLREYAEHLLEKREREQELQKLAEKELAFDHQAMIAKQIQDKFKENLINVGTENSTAEAYATSFSRAMMTLSQRAGIDPMQLAERFSVSRPMPGVLSESGRADIQLDPLLDALRSGNVPTDKEIFGKNLLEFIKEKGGINPELGLRGELLSFDEGKKGFARISNKQSKYSLDRMAEAAVEAGYFPGKSYGKDSLTEAEMMEAISQGDSIYSRENRNNSLEEYRFHLESLQRQLSKLGIDISVITDNAVVRNLLDQAVQNMKESDPDVFDLFQKMTQEPSGKQASAPVVSSLGFFSQLQNEIEKMDFKSMPVKDFLNRLKNIPGIKQEEIEFSGLNDFLTLTQQENGKVTKEALKTFFDTEGGVKIDQVVLGKTQDEDSASSVEEVSWGELERDNESNWDDISNEMDYYLNENDEWRKENAKEIRNELLKNHWADYGESEDDLNYDPDTFEFYSYGQRQLEKDVEDTLRQRAEDIATEYVESDDYPGARYIVEVEWGDGGRNNRDYIHGSDEIGWYNNEAGDLGYNLNEAKIKFVSHLVETGVLETDLSKLVKQEEIEWKSPKNEISYDDNRKSEIAYFKKNKKKFLEAAKNDSDYWGEEEPTKDKIEERAIELSDDEHATLALNPDDKKNKITIRIDSPILEAKIVGNNVKGWRLEYTDYNNNEDYTVSIDSKKIKTIKDAKNEAIKLLIEKALITPSNKTEGGIDAPTGKPKFGSFIIKKGNPENYREFLLQLKLPFQGKDFVYASHFSQPNIVSHIRATDRVINNKKTLFIEEVQSDWHQQGRERGYGSEANESVPNAPFKQTDAWASLAMKRMLRVAVDGGYEAIAWSPAHVQIDRWGTDQIGWTKKEESKSIVVKSIPEGYKVIDIAKNDKELEFFVVDKESDGTRSKEAILSAKNKAEEFAKKLSSPHFLVGASELRGGNANDMNLEETARQRGILLERNGVVVTTKEELKEVVRDVLSRERNDRSLDSLTDSIWKQMQENPSGERKPRAEGMTFMYDNLLKKVTEKITKKLDPNSKIENGIFGSPYMDEEERKNKVDSHFVEITPEMRDKVLEGFTLFQKDDDVKGYIQVGGHKLNIALLEKSDLSTLLHELGHGYLEIIQDLSSQENANPQLKQDFSTILNWFGVTEEQWKGFSMEERRQYHEQFARGHEAYLMEGKAPSEELRSIFSRFKDWLKFIYKQLTALNVTLSDEVRGVFDRIYATDDEITAARKDVPTEPLFATAKDAGMSEAEFEVYRKAVAKQIESGKEALMQKLINEMQREKTKAWKAEKLLMKNQVEQEISERPDYRAFSALKAGKLDDDTPVKLNRTALKERYGKDFVKRIPSVLMTKDRRNGGMDPETAASFLGYESGDKLIEDMISLQPKDKVVKAEVEKRMIEKHGDMLLDMSVVDQAKIALHNEDREKVLMTELQAINRKRKEAAPFVRAAMQNQRERSRAALNIPPKEFFRDTARDIVSKTAVKDLQPYTYLRAQRKAAKESFENMSNGNFELAKQAKERELLNHYLYLEATDAKEDADRILEYAKKFDKTENRQKLAKAGDYLDQIDAILDRYEFRRVPLSQLKKRRSLMEWIQEQEAAGLEPSISESVLDEARQINYKEVQIGELRAMRDAIKNIEHLSRLKRKLITQREEREFSDVISELVSAAVTNVKVPIDPNAQSFSEKFKDSLISIVDAPLIKMEQMIEWLDAGDVNGPWHRYLWTPIADAQFAEHDLTKKVTKKIAESFEKLPKDQRTSMLDTYDIPGMGKVTKKYIMSIAFNMGNQENIDKMMRGHSWSMTTIEGALQHLNAADWQFVQETWDTINDLWPEIAALEKKMTGLIPPKVEARPFETKDADGNVIARLRGGYFPLVYDPRFSEQGAKQESGPVSELFEQGYARATTPKGHTKARVEGFAAPLMLDFEHIVTGHLTKVIKDLTHRQAIVAANKIITNKEVRFAIQSELGVQYEKQFLPWLRSVVNDRNAASQQGVKNLSRFMLTLRANTVAATMGFKATTAISQIVGLSQSLDKVKARYLAQALTDYLKHPVKVTNEVREMSGEIRYRAETLDRDIRGRLQQLINDNSPYAKAQKFAFHGIALADAIVTVPTWLGAYRQAIAEGKTRETAILEADAAVRLTQGAGGAKDLSAVQRSNDMMKLITMFYSYFNVLYNRMRDMGRDVQSISDMPRFLARAFFTIAVPAVMGELIVGRGPDDDEDPAEWAIRKTLIYPMMSIPLLRDIASSVESGYDYRFTPMATGLEKISKLAVQTGKLADGEAEWGDYAVNAASTIGYASGVPGTAQMTASGKYLWRVAEGEERPENIAELIGYTAVGKKPEK